jgi:hypothetical protein
MIPVFNARFISPDQIGNVLRNVGVIPIPASVKRVQVKAAQYPNRYRHGFVLRFLFRVCDFINYSFVGRAWGS